MDEGYKAPRAPRILGGSIAALVVCGALLAINWNAFKESYFNRTLAICASGRSAAMADWQSWPQVLTFDREVRRYRAQNADDMAAMTCVERWGGWLTTDVEVADEYSTANESAELQVSIAGGHYAPPQRIFTATYIEFVEPADTGAN